VVFCLGLLATPPATGFAGIIGIGAVAGDDGGGNNLFPPGPFFSLGAGPRLGDELHPIFKVLLHKSDVGKTFITTPTSDPNFAPLAALLTNGRTDFVTYLLKSGPFAGAVGHTESEQSFFHLSSVDFQGFVLDSISFRLDQLSLGSDFHIRGLIIVEGPPVPEPTTLILLGTGLLIVMGCGWRRRSQRS
jgi:hypothetical protein